MSSVGYVCPGTSGGGEVGIVAATGDVLAGSAAVGLVARIKDVSRCIIAKLGGVGEIVIVGIF